MEQTIDGSTSYFIVLSFLMFKHFNTKFQFHTIHFIMIFFKSQDTPEIMIFAD